MVIDFGHFGFDVTSFNIYASDRMFSRIITSRPLYTVVDLLTKSRVEILIATPVGLIGALQAK